MVKVFDPQDRGPLRDDKEKLVPSRKLITTDYFHGLPSLNLRVNRVLRIVSIHMEDQSSILNLEGAQIARGLRNLHGLACGHDEELPFDPGGIRVYLSPDIGGAALGLDRKDPGALGHLDQVLGLGLELVLEDLLHRMPPAAISFSW